MTRLIEAFKEANRVKINRLLKQDKYLDDNQLFQLAASEENKLSLDSLESYRRRVKPLLSKIQYLHNDRGRRHISESKRRQGAFTRLFNRVCDFYVPTNESAQNKPLFMRRSSCPDSKVYDLDILDLLVSSIHAYNPKQGVLINDLCQRALAKFQCDARDYYNNDFFKDSHDKLLRQTRRFDEFRDLINRIYAIPDSYKDRKNLVNRLITYADKCCEAYIRSEVTLDECVGALEKTVEKIRDEAMSQHRHFGFFSDLGTESRLVEKLDTVLQSRQKQSLEFEYGFMQDIAKEGGYYMKELEDDHISRHEGVSLLATHCRRTIHKPYSRSESNTPERQRGQVFN